MATINNGLKAPPAAASEEGTMDSVFTMLKKYDQEHLIAFMNKLPENMKETLIRELDGLDWGLLDIIRNKDSKAGRGEISPISVLTIPQIKEKEEAYTETGIKAIQDGKVAAMLLAGGMGTRLGCKGPKGVFDIGVTHELYIFEQLFRNAMDSAEAAGKEFPFFIMTSDKNHEETVQFLKDHNFFGYPAELVHFFKQDMAPCVDFDGHLLMESAGKLATSPNGNGGWYSSFVKAGMLPVAEQYGVEWLNCFAVDNVLQRICDPCFIGAVLAEGKVSGAKVVSKADPHERVGVLCLEDGKPSIVEYYELGEDMAMAKNEAGEYLYNYGVILNYLFRIDKLNEIIDKRMPLHEAEKKIPYVDPDGTAHSPETPNGYKFETLILDMVHMMDDCLGYEVDRNREFAPVKNITGVDSVESARALLKLNGVEL